MNLYRLYNNVQHDYYHDQEGTAYLKYKLKPLNTRMVLILFNLLVKYNILEMVIVAVVVPYMLLIQA